MTCFLQIFILYINILNFANKILIFSKYCLDLNNKYCLLYALLHYRAGNERSHLKQKDNDKAMRVPRGKGRSSGKES